MKTPKDLLLEVDQYDNDQLEDLYSKTYFELIKNKRCPLSKDEQKEIRREIGLFHFMNELHHKHIDIVLYSCSIFVLLNALVDFSKDYQLHMFNMSLIVLGFFLAFLGLEIMYPTLKDHKKLINHYIKQKLRKAKFKELKRAA